MEAWNRMRSFFDSDEFNDLDRTEAESRLQNYRAEINSELDNLE